MRSIIKDNIQIWHMVLIHSLSVMTFVDQLNQHKKQTKDDYEANQQGEVKFADHIDTTEEDLTTNTNDTLKLFVIYEIIKQIYTLNLSIYLNSFFVKN